MHLLDIHRRPESFESRQPDNPIVDVGVEPRRLAAERIDALFSHGERKPCIVGETVLLFQVGVAARQEVEVVERREPVVARDGGLGHDVAPLGNRIIGEEGWNNRGPLRPEHLFAQRERQAQPVGGHPLGRNIPRQFDAPLVITHDHFFIVPLRYRLGIELQHVPVLALHEMLVHGDIGSKEPFLADVVLPFDGAVKRIDETPRANHLRPVPVTFVLREIVSLPRMYIPSTSPDLIIFSPMIPRKNTAESLFTLFVAILRIGTIIDVEHRNAAPRMDIPRLQSEPVAPARVVISLLEHVQVVEIPALVPLDGIVRADDVAVVIVDIHLLVVVPIPEIVGRRGVDHSRGGLPAVAAVGEPQEFVECRERSDALHVLHVEPTRLGRAGREGHGAAQTAARHIDRRRAVQQRGVVDEIRRNHRKIGHAEHRRIDAHAVPRHLRVRARCAAERHGRERGAAVLLDENRGVERQYIGHRQGDVLVQHGRIEFRLLHAYLLHRTPGRDTHFTDRNHERRIAVPPAAVGRSRLGRGLLSRYGRRTKQTYQMGEFLHS